MVDMKKKEEIRNMTLNDLCMLRMADVQDGLEFVFEEAIMRELSLIVPSYFNREDHEETKINEKKLIANKYKMLEENGTSIYFLNGVSTPKESNLDHDPRLYIMNEKEVIKIGFSLPENGILRITKDAELFALLNKAMQNAVEKAKK